MAVSIGTVIALIKALGGKPDAATIIQAVNDWLDDHPEATTTVEDGSITEAKLASALAALINGKQDAPGTEGTAGQVLGLDNSLNPKWVDQSGGGGTSDYSDLTNKPQINSVTLSGNKSLSEFGIHNVPPSGTTGQVLAKKSDTDYDTEWTDQASGGGDVTDVQVNGVSVLSQGVANIPKATDSVLGVAKFSSGLFASSNGTVTVNKASGANVKDGTESYKPIVPSNQNEAVFYGLAKLAGYDMKNDSSAVGSYPAQAIDAILQMLGVFDLIAQHETTPSTHAYAQGECFIFNGKLCRATTAISVSDAITVGTNCENTTLMAEITR